MVELPCIKKVIFLMQDVKSHVPQHLLHVEGLVQEHKECTEVQTTAGIYSHFCEEKKEKRSGAKL